jgi:hypothetical protein
MTAEANAEELINVVCRDLLGSPAQRELFTAGIGRVHGLRLHDCRDVVVKIHPAATSLTKLQATHQAQLSLVDAGFPCPRPVIAPASLPGHGPITVEYLVTGGGPGRPRTAAHRTAMVEAFHWHSDLLRAQPASGMLREPPGWADLRTRASIWPRPHDPTLRFAACPEVRWIDELAAAALDELRRFSGPVILAHCDWESQNMLFNGPRLHVVFDWDSLLVERAACLVGLAAGCHTAQGEPGVSDSPSTADVELFLDLYAEASGRPWTRADRRAAAASALWLRAYNARIEQASAIATSWPWSTALSADYLGV